MERNQNARDLVMPSAYTPKAVYFDESDTLEYSRLDGPTIFRRVDGYLTLVLDIDSREPVGFALKGFRHFYLTVLKPQLGLNETHFVALIRVLEAALGAAGDSLFEEAERQKAYRQALEIAQEDEVLLEEFPEVA